MENDETTNLSTEAETPEAEAPEVDENEALASDDADDADADGEGLEDDEEFDVDGELIKVPKSIAEKLKAGFMKSADYTQKTQSAAEERKQLAAERQSLQWESETQKQLFNEEAQLLTVRQRLDQFQGINWAALAQQDMQQHAVMQAEYTQLKDYHDRLSGHVEGRKSELKQHSEQATAIALERAVQNLSTPDQKFGWDGKFDADKRQELTKFGLELGFTNEELSNTSHPLMIKGLWLMRVGAEALRKQTATLKKPVAEAKPVPTVTSAGKAKSAVNPDNLSAEEWVKWRESGLAKKAARNR